MKTIIEDMLGNPGLGLFFWEDGAPFQFVVNQVMGEQFPDGLDPTLTNNPLHSNESLANITLSASITNRSNFIIDILQLI